MPSPHSNALRSELRDDDAVAVSDDLAAGDLRLVGDDRLEFLLADPVRDELCRLLALLGRLEETERADDAVAGLDQEVGTGSSRVPPIPAWTRDVRAGEPALKYGPSVSAMVGRPEHRRAVSVWPAPAEVPAGRVVVAEPALPALLSLLDVAVEDQQWQNLDPLQRRRRTLEAIKRARECGRRRNCRAGKIQRTCSVNEHGNHEAGKEDSTDSLQALIELPDAAAPLQSHPMANVGVLT